MKEFEPFSNLSKLGCSNCTELAAWRDTDITTRRYLCNDCLHSLFNPPQKSILPEDDAARKAIPMWTGSIAYFPAAIMLEAMISHEGNEQHNPGEPLHWARDKSTDHMNCAFRHMFDSLFVDGEARLKVLAQARWRLGAEIQTSYEKIHGQEGNTTRSNAHAADCICSQCVR